MRSTDSSDYFIRSTQATLAVRAAEELLRATIAYFQPPRMSVTELRNTLTRSAADIIVQTIYYALRRHDYDFRGSVRFKARHGVSNRARERDQSRNASSGSLVSGIGPDLDGEYRRNLK